jgi:hypothetical protein
VPTTPLPTRGLLFLQAAATTAEPQRPADASADSRSTAFRAVEGGNQMQSGEKLMVEAYAAIWVLLFAMILLAWRRQTKTDERIAYLEQAVAKARAEAPSASRAGNAAEAADA